MRGSILVAVLLLAGTGTPALAEATLDGLAAVPAGELGGERGGTDAATVSGNLVQTNNDTVTGTNTGTIGVGYGGQKLNGDIAAATMAGNHGLSTMMQNTGDLVNMNNATNVNVYLR
ncbi:MAG: hypothetical protein ACM31L_00280 [Actinomycetota bacterium]